MLLRTEQLSVSFRQTRKTTTRVTFETDIEIDEGEVVALVGESGSGKSVTAMEIAGLNPRNTESSGHAYFNGADVLGLPRKARRELLRKDIGVIFQDPLSSLNPVYTVGTSMAMSMKYRAGDKKSRRARAVELLERVNIPDPERAVERYPHELSGGQRQRVMIAMAIDAEPKLLIADEPTTALDVTVQADILDLIEDLKNRLDMSVLLITHDMGVVANSADKLYVMQHGRVCEEGSVQDVFAAPQHEYTQKLFAAVPSLDVTALSTGGESSAPIGKAEKSDRVQAPTAVSFRNLDYYYSLSLEKEGRKALDGITFDVPQGETVGLVGESGSGKSTIGRIAVGLLAPSSGTLDLHAREGRGLTRSMVFQDPASSLDPRRTISESISAPLLWGNHGVSRREAMRKARSLLDRVQLPANWGDRLPHELSGGQRQRVGIARGLSIDPDLLVADEPTSALDVSVQAAVLELFTELQEEFGFSCLFISHDLAVVEQIADQLVVLQKGRIEEAGSTRDIIYNPQSEYTRKLIKSVPVADPQAQRQRKLQRV